MRKDGKMGDYRLAGPAWLSSCCVEGGVATQPRARQLMGGLVRERASDSRGRGCLSVWDGSSIARCWMR